ncbi:sugar ABC transporter permease [Streptomyces abyssalis]|uniref:Sugar ABC transporter permease n=1 Tax=Streptomyces abyssalis TaxID=933944 RepID=A0A1E7JSJ1_9ACTN|nr:sugar ABC transporter permease [Streptomyces abyssalis]OEU94043.1 sugar ABC transporter permease [Streptomyces abyssalis]OEV28112.1 sugar ABC transporter permease [Streptomyces nanshensis]
MSATTTPEAAPAAPVTSARTTPPGPRRVPPPGRILLVASLAVATVYFLLPVYWLVIAATKSTDKIYGSNGFWFDSPRLLENIGKVLSYDGHVYLYWVANTLLYAGVGALLATLLAAAAGFALAKYRFRGREAVFKSVLAGVLLPHTALALPLYLLFNKVGLTNTYWAVLIPSVVSPFGVYLCRIFAESSVDDTLLEAARVDGAREGRIFFGLALRIMSPALVTVFLFQFVGIWNNYFLPLVMLSDDRMYPITLGLTTWQTSQDRIPELVQYTVGGAFLSVIPLAVAMLVLQRYWRTGLTEGSVKG